MRSRVHRASSAVSFIAAFAAARIAAAASAQQAPAVPAAQTPPVAPPPAGAPSAPAATPAPSPKRIATEAATTGSDQTETIVVTGSRITRDEFTSASPVQAITRDRSTLAGLSNAGQIVQGSAAAAGSGQINSTFTGFVVEGGPGVSTVSLRGLGAQRSLILLNGRRLPPAGVGGQVGAVDFNILPNSIVNRYEILKDGASSIYGSDAVAGVVNVITRTRLEGAEVTANVKAARGGGDEYQFEGGWGRTWDRASLSASFEFNQRKSLQYGDRSFFACPQDHTYAAATSLMPAVTGYVLPARTVSAGDRSDLIDPRTGQFKCFTAGVSGYVITYNPFAGFGVASRTPNAPIAGLTFNGAANNPIPGWRFIPYQERTFDDPRSLTRDAISPADRYSVFIQGDWRPEGLGSAELYTEILANRRESSNTSFRQLFPDVNSQSSINPFNATLGPLQRFATPIVLVPSDQEQDVDVARVLAGVRGDIGGSGWSYDVYAIQSRSRGDYLDDVVPEDRLIAGTGTLQDGSFGAVGVCNSMAPTGCIPFTSLFTSAGLAGQFTPAEQAYFFTKDRGNTKYDQSIVEAQFTGDLLSMPAGPLAAALGVTWRQDKIDDTPGPVTISGNSWARLTAGRTKGDDSLVEAYGEFEIPLLRGAKLAQNLSLNVSGRYSDYDSVGDATTYKINANWKVNDLIRFRSTYGTSFRAPALYELYLADQITFLSQQRVDPCIRWGDPESPANATIQANCRRDGITDPLFAGGSTSAEILRGGGLGRLKPEDSDSTTVGLVLTPPGSGLSVAVDYFDINVDNQITSFAFAAIGACYSSEAFRSQPGFCDLFTRNPAPDRGIAQVDASYRNIVNQRVTGFDVTTSYDKDFTFGKLEVDADITYSQDDDTELFAGRTFLPNGTVGEPEWVGQVQTRLKRKDWTFAWTLNYTGKGNNFGYEGEDGIVDPLAGLTVLSTNRTDVASWMTHDFSVRFERDTWSLVVGATNAFDKVPPIIGEGDDVGSIQRLGSVPLSSQYYDGYVGRTFFVNVAWKP